MGVYQNTFWLIALATVQFRGSQSGGDAVVRMEITDPGYAQNCGSVPFNVSWTPKVLSDSHPVNIMVDYVVPFDMNGGFLNASVTEYGDTEPFLAYATNFTCNDVKAFLPCPLKKDLHIIRTVPIEKTRYLQSFPGRYIAEVKVKNEKGDQMICAKFDFVVKND